MPRGVLDPAIEWDGFATVPCEHVSQGGAALVKYRVDWSWTAA
jgi:hypothetical protein